MSDPLPHADCANPQPPNAMPTTPKEQLLAGICQLEKAGSRLPDGPEKAQLTAELDTLLDAVRADVPDEELPDLYAAVNRLAQRMTAAMPTR